MAEKLALGLDLGSVNNRIAVVDQNGQLLHLDTQRITGSPLETIGMLLAGASKKIPLTEIEGAAVVGSGRQLYEGEKGWKIYSSAYAAINGLMPDYPDARTIIAIGGQTALVIGLSDGLNKDWQVVRSPLCAAGTGRFLEQQAERLGISIEEFGSKALEWTKESPRIAARCSVFAKTDLIHRQQEGWPVSAMLSGLSESVAMMIVSQWRDKFESPVLLTGGVASNQAVVRALSSAIGTDIIVPFLHADREVIGAALLARDASEWPATLAPIHQGPQLFFVSKRLIPLPRSNGGSNGYGKAEDLNGSDVYLGVDVGSTSTKGAVITPEGKVIAKHYLMTAGQPLEAVKQVMADLAEKVEGRVGVKGVGVTGSGRYLVGHFLGADLIKNEITAQTRAALQIDPDVTTIFELGGQDSKYVFLKNGVVLDQQMNKVCAAGTGSFIDELSHELGVSARNGEFADLAFEAGRELDLGEKCAVFMSQAVTSAFQQGASLGEITSSLSVSLAKNYRSKVLGNRRVGERVFLTGAVFYNEAVVAAFRAEFPDKKLVVPEHKEVTGAIGVALLAKEEMQEKGESSFLGFSRAAEALYKLRTFTCHRCGNFCTINMMEEGKRRFFYGSRCDFYDAQGGQKKGKVEVNNPFTELKELLFGLKETNAV